MTQDDGIVKELRAKAWQSSRPSMGKFHETHICWKAADRIEALEEGLRPFAEAANLVPDEEGDDYPTEVLLSRDEQPTVGDLRRARALLNHKD